MKILSNGPGDVYFKEKLCSQSWDAIEYEHPGSHCYRELVEKKEAIEKAEASPLFVCQHANFDDVEKAVGTENVVPRGIRLVEKLNEMCLIKVEK